MSEYGDSIGHLYEDASAARKAIASALDDCAELMDEAWDAAETEEVEAIAEERGKLCAAWDIVNSVRTWAHGRKT